MARLLTLGSLSASRSFGYYEREGVAVEVIDTEDQEPQIADFTTGKYDGMVLPITCHLVRKLQSYRVREIEPKLFEMSAH